MFKFGTLKVENNNYGTYTNNLTYDILFPCDLTLDKASVRTLK